ncbi:MAG: hypothetical protein JW863_10525 [Chitinispirillaceae bacterium]|nr:hypothetical protein [Chitinispirillaceae bacterium]
MNPNRCPVVTPDFELIHRYLADLPLEELIFQTEEIFGTLSTTEKSSYNINRFCSSYADVEGRINFVRALIDNAVISTVHIPFSYNRDERLINLLRPKVFDYFLPIAQELKEDGAALTDDLETPLSDITVTNPRWEHVDDARKEESPAVARIGDTIALFVDVSGYPEGAPVTFDIFDKTRDPAMRIETERGKNEGGTARIEWVVCDPDERGEALKLEFEGSARSKSSGRAPIDLKLEAIYRVELKDEDGNVLEGIKVEFTVPGEDPVVVRTDANGIAEHQAADPSVDADVRILWEESGEEGATEDAGENESDDTTEETTGTDGSAEAVTVAADEPVTVVAPETQEQVSEETSTEKGFEVLLVDDRDEPLKGIEVQFSVAGEEPVSVVTDDQGKATLTTEAAGGAEEADVKVVWKE